MSALLKIKFKSRGRGRPRHTFNSNYRGSGASETPQKLNAALQAEFGGDGFHGFDAEGDVFVEIDA